MLLQSCKHESWVSISKHLMDDLPVFLSSENVKDVKDVLSTLLSNLPPNFADFIKWVAEVRRQEENGQKLSEEEKGRLAIKVRYLDNFSKLKKIGFRNGHILLHIPVSSFNRITVAG